MNHKLISEEFSLIQNQLYFNTAAAGPSPLRAKKALDEAFQRELDPKLHEYSEWGAIPELVREKLSRFTGFPVDSISHHSSVGEIMSLIANGIRFESGDCVVGFQAEYPSDVLPWMLLEKNKGVKFYALDSSLIEDPLRLAEHLPPQTRILNLSHVSFHTGNRADLLLMGKICRDRDILFVVDGSQSMGALAVSKEELELIDVYACVTYKWLLGTYGHAFAYFSERALSRIERTVANWMVSSNSKDSNSLTEYTLETLPGARRFDRGQAPNMLLMRCLSSSLDLLNEIGAEKIQNHDLQLVECFLSSLSEKKYEQSSTSEKRSSIVSIRPRDRDSAEVYQNLKTSNVSLSLREGRLRFSFHLFNSPAQIDQLVRLLEGG